MPKNVSPAVVVTVVVLAAIALVAVGYSLHTKTTAGCQGCGGRGNVAISGTITAPDSYGVSQMTLEVNNTARDPIWTIAVVDSSGLAGSTYVGFYHNTALVSAANALSVDQTAVGTISVRNVTESATYVLTVGITFSSGAAQNQTISLTAGD